MTSSYPRPDERPRHTSIATRDASAIPQFSPSIPPVLPPLPSPPRDPDFLTGYTVTTHLVPAASPRESIFQERRHAGDFPSISPVIPSEKVKTKQDRAEWSKRMVEALNRKRTGITEAMIRAESTWSPLDYTEEDAGPLLWNAINRYARLQEQRDTRDVGLTVVIAHANGMHKETWEPTIKHLIELSDNPRTGIHVDEIWSFEAVNHGDSALINEGKLGDVFDWMDNARDILSFVENYIPDGPFVPTTTPLPTHLPRVSPDVAAERREQGFKHRNLVGIGHSLGGCSIANAASANSNLFHSLTLVDPIIYFQPSEWTTRFAVSALTRRQRWDSREEALLLFKKSPFFGAWKPEVLELYVKYALADIPREKGGGVKLKMSGFSEASVFVEQFFPLETAQQLETLDSMVKLRWIVAGKDVDLEKAALVQEMVWRRIENSANVLIEGAGHLIAQEAPYELAKETVYGWRVMYAEKQDPIWSRL